nr:MAG TPA: hypothetical protein [Caudoviricetes sp.]
MQLPYGPFSGLQLLHCLFQGGLLDQLDCICTAKRGQAGAAARPGARARASAHFS